ncbi:MAG: UDP-2,4-diacetamido-2,4,6-trideoxy-beta-L-altropyranose hydrolase [Deltaproteobacteria bacterium HGW-Deltaproteobacteria-19]|jgi:UDP-2,4-diacetamido-2,4,6-trideoxy-beta-L-altropyranose hydrolase|nr:MAG: UDP-2,4-diacetamido-2,4,6-trideoxy-beta-L-altropyranose hydrolase [Deltaproteobacteria bacterium HGW-Deltaproteobacteria-19]
MGHLKRCLTLAEELKRQGADLFFLCRAQDMDLSLYIGSVASEWSLCDWSLSPEEDAGEVVRHADQYRVNAVIVDHYRANPTYQKVLLDGGIRWLQLDGAANWPIWADWILNMSPAARDTLYEPLRRRGETRFLLGPRYALLREEFRHWYSREKERETVRAILLTFGGGDDRGATIFCLDALRPLGRDIERIVLLAGANPRREEIQRWVREEGFNIRVIMNVSETASIMASADLAVMAGGMTVFETAALGVPALTLQIADNQKWIAGAWQQSGYAVDLGPLEELREEVLHREVSALMKSPELRRTMSTAGRSMVDGLGTQRVARALLSS